jgi:uncharacterized protein (DUF1800 family)
MQRRSFLSSFTSGEKTSTLERPPLGLEKYTGNWSDVQAGHLLRRSVFGPEFKDIKDFTKLGLEKAIDKLLDIAPLAVDDVPINTEYEADSKVPIGSTWINKGPEAVNNNYRFKSLYAWTTGRLLRKEINLREKMTLFWHNHFVVADMNDARYFYHYMNNFVQNPVGNFKDYTLKMTIDPAMLRYLNGNQNTKKAPNENYARELLELFTIGKGPIAGPGDYTNYTEEDIKEIARVLTGWNDIGNRNPNVDNISSIFRVGNHDTDTKKLSKRFNNEVIVNAGQDEYKKLMDVIFKQNEVSKFIARKIYRWFVYYQIDSAVESDVIEPMAKIIRDNNFEIKPVLKALLSSAHFYNNIGCMIKNPIDFLISGVNQNGYLIEGTDVQKYNIWVGIYSYSNLLQMRYYYAPNVAGWKAYYQEPVYYQTWINSVTLPLRKSFTDAICNTNIAARGIRIDIDVLSVIKEFTNPKNLDALIVDAALLLLPKPLSSKQIEILKNIVVPGLPDYEWTEEYEAYLAKPTDAGLKKAVETKLRAMFTYIMRMPEYQLS